MGRIVATDARAISASALSDIYRETKQFIPTTVVAQDRDRWILSNLQQLAMQVRRSRYHLDNVGIRYGYLF